MAATSITINNTKQALIDGIINGDFNGKRTIFRFKNIKYTISNGKISNWTLLIKLLNNNEEMISITEEMLEGEVIENGYKAIIETESGQEGGKIRKITPTIITTGKHIGAANETNIIEQAFRDALGLYNKKLKKVASNIVHEINSPSSMSPSSMPPSSMPPSIMSPSIMPPSIMPPPMLVQNITKNPLHENDFKNGITLQKKLNGVHYITFFHLNKVIKYSRGGLIYSESSMPNITMELGSVFNNMIEFTPSNAKRYKIPNIDLYTNAVPYLAGELYKHGIPLNIISGQARKEITTIYLEYHIFDVFFPLAIENGHNMESKYRQRYLDDLFLKLQKLKLQNIKRVDNIKVHSMDEINELVSKYIEDGYEGGIVRKDNGIYRYSINNYHSKEILKIKPIFDDEFPIVGFTQGKKGKDLGAVIWICSCTRDHFDAKGEDIKTFHVVPNLSLTERKELFKIGDTFIGKMLTVSYAELSKDGAPIQPKGIAIRDYE